MVKTLDFYLEKCYIQTIKRLITIKTGKKNMPAQGKSITLQQQCVEMIERIQQKRFNENNIKDSKTRIISEAVNELAKKELDE